MQQRGVRRAQKPKVMRTKLTSNGHVVVGMPLSIEDAIILRKVRPSPRTQSAQGPALQSRPLRASASMLRVVWQACGACWCGSACKECSLHCTAHPCLAAELGHRQVMKSRHDLIRICSCPRSLTLHSEQDFVCCGPDRQHCAQRLSEQEQQRAEGGLDG